MHPIRRTSVIFCLVAALVSSAARPASAGAPDPLKVRCEQLGIEGKYRDALEACEKAAETNPDPELLSYIAQIQTALLHPVQAREALRRYLKAGQLKPGERKTAEDQIRFLDTQIATLSVTTRLEGAEIRVDDEVVDPNALGRGVPLPTGAHRVTLQTKGSTFSRFIFLRAGELTQIELPGSGTIALSCAIPEVRFFIDDQEVNGALAARSVPRDAGSHRVTFKAGATTWPAQTVMVNPDERVSVVCAAPPAAQVTAAEPRSRTNPRGYWIAGAGLALGGAALATAIYNGSDYDRWKTANDDLRRVNDTLVLSEQNKRAQENDRLMESIQTRRKIAVGLGIAGALVTAGGVVLLFADSAATERNASASWFRKIVAGVTLDGAVSSGEIAWAGAW